ncbi:MAG: hypothetical protein QXK88_09685 [Desulfurococcaceae archaeon]
MVVCNVPGGVDTRSATAIAIAITATIAINRVLVFILTTPVIHNPAQGLLIILKDIAGNPFA